MDLGISIKLLQPMLTTFRSHYYSHLGQHCTHSGKNY